MLESSGHEIFYSGPEITFGGGGAKDLRSCIGPGLLCVSLGVGWEVFLGEA